MKTTTNCLFFCFGFDNSQTLWTKTQRTSIFYQEISLKICFVHYQRLLVSCFSVSFVTICVADMIKKLYFLFLSDYVAKCFDLCFELFKQCPHTNHKKIPKHKCVKGKCKPKFIVTTWRSQKPLTFNFKITVTSLQITNAAKSFIKAKYSDGFNQNSITYAITQFPEFVLSFWKLSGMVNEAILSNGVVHN